jgi:hypothetical protein
VAAIPGEFSDGWSRSRAEMVERNIWVSSLFLLSSWECLHVNDVVVNDVDGRRLLCKIEHGVVCQVTMGQDICM